VTFSLVACDSVRGEWGVAVASKFLAVGALVPWVEAGVGAVATQAIMNPTYGRDGLTLLREGLGPDAVLARLTAGDEGRDDRQVGIVDRSGGAANRTGARCIAWAGGRTGPGYAAQGNILVSGATVDALAETFAASAGSPLAMRLMRALSAGQEAGGDRRGQQAAALLVARVGGGYGGSDVAVDLRVDDHPQPVAELKRLLTLHELYFGTTPTEQWLPVDAQLGSEMRALLERRGYASGDVEADLMAWAAMENLEERVAGANRIDPVVLEALRS
jgi:uncharacterized Ntn-hydrolase superfamily protein